METDRIRVLVVTYLPWRNDVSVGNTLSNLFGGLQDRIQFANIYFKGGKPQNEVAESHFYIPESQLAKSIITRKPVGGAVQAEKESGQSEKNKESGMYNKARQMRWESMLLAQDLIGLCGNWKSKELNDFIARFRPDIVFGPLGRVPAANVLMKYIHEQFHIPVVAYAWDDHYSLKKKSFSPFFWIKTFLERRYIRQCAAVSSYLYTITAPMKEEYQQYFNKDCRILYKGYEFSGEYMAKNGEEGPVRIVYMGNIGAGRWRVIAKFAQEVAELNREKKRAELLIYTMSPKSEKIEKALEIDGSSRLMKPVSSSEVLPTMRGADILLHVEPTNEKDRLFFRLSFSTKIVDYLYCGRCIFALGGRTAAMEYLLENDAAVVELREDQIRKRLAELLEDPERMRMYGQKAWECGVRNHQRGMIQNRIYHDFLALIPRKA